MELDGLYELRSNLIALKRRKDAYDDIRAEQAIGGEYAVYAGILPSCTFVVDKCR